jgi:hypothetical protein
MSLGLNIEYSFESCDGSRSLENHGGEGLDGRLSGDANITLGDGKIVNALTISGDGMMSVDHDSDLDIVDDLTIAFWINPLDIRKQGLITRGLGSGKDRQYATNAEYFLMMKETGKLAYRHNFVDNNGTVIAFTDSNISTNKWTHVVFIRDNSAKTLRFYINGVANTEYSYTGNPSSSHSEKLVVGQCDGCVKPYKFSGKLDEIKIYDRSLTQEEITLMYDNESSGIHNIGLCHSAPLAVNDSADLPYAGSTSVDVLSNDRDNDSDSCSVDVSTVMIRVDRTDVTLSENNKTLIVPNEGTWSVNNSNGSISFVSLSGFLGNPTDIKYTVSDSCDSVSNRAIVSLTRVSAPIVTPTPYPSPIPVPSNPTPTPTSIPTDSAFIVGDRVWFDIDKNGIQGSGENGVADVIVVLFDKNGTVVDKTTTNSSGIYELSTVLVGSYSLGFSNLPENYVFTSPNRGSNDAKDSDVDSSGRTSEFKVGSVKSDLIYDAGVVATGNSPTSTPTSTPSPTPPIVEEDCNCDDYKSTIPSISKVGFVLVTLLISLLGVLFLREKELNLS